MTAGDERARTPGGRTRATHRFLAVTSSELVTGIFFDTVTVSRDRLLLRPFLRRTIEIGREEIGAVELERQWLPPFLMKTVCRIRFADGSYAPKVIVPGAPKALGRSLVAFGWPMRQVSWATTEPQVARDKPPWGQRRTAPPADTPRGTSTLVAALGVAMLLAIFVLIALGIAQLSKMA